jgi:hypothetical protein
LGSRQQTIGLASAINETSDALVLLELGVLASLYYSANKFLSKDL